MAKYRILFQVVKTFDGEMTVEADSALEAWEQLVQAHHDGVIFDLVQNGQKVVDSKPTQNEIQHSQSELM